MSKDKTEFGEFLIDVSPEISDLVAGLHDFILAEGCGYRITLAARSKVMSYVFPKTKRVAANLVFRKKGLLIRIYADNVASYADALDGLPPNAKKSVLKAPDCKRLADPSKCLPTCSMGYIFSLNGVACKKCRYSCFMLEVNEENDGIIRALIQNEIEARTRK